MQALPNAFRDKTINSGIWPVCIPELNLSDLFFWGCLKGKVYKSNPQFEELKENIFRKVTNISAENLKE
jgi:hypothetical protein